MQGKLGVLSALAMMVVLALPAMAGDTVTATVTPLVVRSVTLDISSVDYGPLSTSTSDGSRTTATSSAITATNNGNSLEDVYVRGTDAVDANSGDGVDTPWTLDCSSNDSDPDGVVALDQYVHRYDLGNTFVPSEALTICKHPTPGQKKIQDNLTASGTFQFVLQINMPTATSGFSARNMTVTLVATAF